MYIFGNYNSSSDSMIMGENNESGTSKLPEEIPTIAKI